MLARHHSVVAAVLLVIGAPATGRTTPSMRQDQSAADAVAAAESSPLLELADAYYEAYAALDLERMVTFLADDVQFRDPTLHLFPGETIDAQAGLMVDGIDQVRAMLGQVFANESLLGLSWEVANRFASGNYVVLQGSFHQELDGRLLGTRERVLRISTTFVTVLEIVNDKIRSQTDYVDYGQLSRQLAPE